MSILSLLRPSHTAAAASTYLNFQARLENATGSIVADGTYNVEFKLYDASSGGTLLWTEDHYNNAANGIRVANGYLSAQLGSITSFGTLNWNQQLWLTMNIGGTSTGAVTLDGEMSPRLQLTATPYSFQAGELGNGTNRAVLDSSGNLAIQQASTVSTTTGLLTLQGAAGVTVQSAAGTTSSAVIIQTGNASSGASGNISIDNGTFTSGTPTVTVGGTNARSIQLGNITGTTTLSIQSGSGGINLQGVATVSANFIVTNAGNVAFQRGSDFATIGSTNDVNLGTGSLVRLTGASAQTITGIANGADGRVLELVNAASQAAVISNQNTGSAAGNRIITGTGTDLTLTPDASIYLVYDSGSSRWRVIGGIGGSGIFFLQGGNSFGAQAVLGSNDNNSLAIRTNGTNHLILDTSGNLQFQQASTVNIASAASGTQLTIKGGDATSGTNAGGALLLEGGAGASTGASGSVTIKANGNNSTSAFVIQNAAGSNLLTADSVNSAFTVNSSLYITTPPAASCSYTNFVNDVLAQTPSAYWKLEDTGATAADSSGNSNTGTVNAGVTVNQTPGPISCATTHPYMNFVPTGSITTTTTYTNPTTFTLFALFKTTSLGPIMSFNGGANVDRKFYVGTDGRLHFGIFNGSFQIIDSATTVNNGAWHAAAVTISGSGTKLYLDGALVATNVSMTTPFNYNGKWIIGAETGVVWSGTTDGSLNFTGNIGQAIYFPSALSGATIATLSADAGFAGSASLGIGTTSPLYPLDIAGSGRAATSFLSPLFDVASAGTLSIGNGTATAIALGSTASNIQTTINGTALFKPTTGNDSTTALQVQNAAATATVLDVDTTNLRVGIGLNNPSVRLDVATSGNAVGILNEATDNGFTAIRSKNTVQGYDYGVASNGAAAPNAFYIYDVNQNAYRLSVNQTTGNIAVGGLFTANALLSMPNTTSTNKLFLFDGSSDKYGFGVQANTLQIYSGAAAGANATISLGKYDGSTYTEVAHFKNGDLQFQGANTINAVGAASGNLLTIQGGAATSGTNTGGNLLLQGGAGSTTGATGSVIVKANTNNSTTAFQVQNASASSLLNVDTINSRVGLFNTTSALGTPGTITLTTTGTGLTGTFKYEVTAIDSAGGETAASPEATSAALSNQGVKLSWAPITGASGYKIYRTAAGGGSGTEKYLTSAPGTIVSGNANFTDNGSLTLGTDTPVSNGAFTATTNASSTLQLTVGGNGTPTGQVYIGGIQPTLVGEYIGNSGTDIDKPQSIFVQDHYMYTISANSGAFTILDINNPASPAIVANTTSNMNTPNSLYVQGKYAYILSTASGTNSTLGVWDISNPSLPTRVGVTAAGLNAPQYVYVQGRYAYVVNASANNNSLAAFDISDPTRPTLTGQVTPTGASAMTGVYVAGRYAYIADYSHNTLDIVDVSNPMAPSVVSQLGGVGGPQWVQVQGRYAYVADFDGNKLQVADVSNPASPVLLSSTQLVAGTGAGRLFVQGRYVYIIDGTHSTLNVLDISNPAKPFSVATTTTGISSPLSLYVQGRYLYEGNTTNRLNIYDLGGSYIQQLEAGGATFSTLNVDTNARVIGDLAVQGGAAFSQGLQAGGNIGVNGGASIQGSTILTGGTNRLSTPGAPTVVAQGTTGATTYTYTLTAINASGGETIASAATTINNGNATLTNTNKNHITWSAVTGASGYKIYRTAGGASQGLLAETSGTSFDDTGAFATGGSSPTLDTTGQFTSTGAALFQNATNSTTALQVQNAAGNQILDVDTTNAQVLFGNASNPGLLVVNGSTNNVGLTAGAVTSSYTLTLPLTGPGTSQCLQSGPVTATTLVFGSCSGGGTTLQGAYNASAGASPSIDMTSTNAGVTLQNDNASPITGELFGVHAQTASGLGGALFTVDNNGNTLVKNRSGNNSTAAFQVQNGSAAKLFTVDTSNTVIVLGNDGTPAALTVRGGAATGSNIAGANITFDASNGTGSTGSGDFIFRTGASMASGTVQFDNAANTSGTSASTLTLSNFTIASNANRLLIVTVTADSQTTTFNSTSGVTWQGSNLTRLDQQVCTALHPCDMELWYMVAPATGTGNVVATLTSGTDNIKISAASYYGVDPSTPLGTETTTFNTTSGDPSNTVSSTTSQLIYDALHLQQGTVSGSSTAGANVRISGSDPFVQDKAGTGSTMTMSWFNSLNISDSFRQMSVPINPAPTNAADTLADRLHITAAGNVGINTASPQNTLDIAGTERLVTNSTTAFQVQNSSNTNVFSVDTTNKKVIIGLDSTGEATPALLVLDSQTGSSTDPTEIDGAMYYNQTTQEFRCGRNGVWQSCGVNPIDRGYSLEDDFMGGLTTNGQIGSMGWQISTISSTGSVSYNGGTPAPTADHPGTLNLATGVGAGTHGNTLIMSGSATGNMGLAVGQVVKASVAFSSTSNSTGNVIRVGLTTETTSAARPTNSGVWWEYDPSVNANWEYCYATTGPAATCAADTSAGTLTTNTFYSVSFVIKSLGSGTSAIDFYLNGHKTSLTGITVTTANLVAPNMVLMGLSSTSQILTVDYYQVQGVASTLR